VYQAAAAAVMAVESHFSLDLEHPMKSRVLMIFAVFCLRAQTPDLYPQVRALVLEAEAAGANRRPLKDRSNPHTWAGDILAQAGYLEDAERAYSKSPGPSSDPPLALWRAWVVYGQRERAETVIESATSTEKKATYFASFADLLWRTGQPEQARARYEAARKIAVKIVDTARRKRMIAAIDQGLQFLSDPPPDLISATPHPRPPFSAQDSPIPLFPITADGFQDVDLEQTAVRARERRTDEAALRSRCSRGSRRY
jgi:tetratricopeptide (TPR) repeat protein